MIKAVIFDLDGTLLNTLEGLKNSTNFALREFGYSEHPIENIRKFVGNGVAKLIERALPDGTANPDYEKCLKTFKEHYSKTMESATRPYDGVVELLKELKSRDMKIAVLSNKFDTAVKTLCDKYFSGLIDIAAGESLTTPPKPNPQGTNTIIKSFSLKPEEVIFVGDSEVDAQTAKNAGLKCVGVLWGFRSEETLKKEGVKCLIHKPEELIQYL